MPTGRPDYWYGTALYFEDSPADGEVTRGPTSNWAFDHDADVNAHHPDPRAAVDVGLGENVAAAGDRRLELWSAGGGTYDAAIIRKSGENGELQFVQSGTAAIAFRPGEAEEIEMPNAGGITGIWDDTPTNGETAKGVTSDWAYDHVNDPSVHHVKYTDAEAVTAMGAKGDANALNHDKWSETGLSAFNLGSTVGTDTTMYMRMYCQVGGGISYLTQRIGGANGAVYFINYGTGPMLFYVNGAEVARFLNGGGITGIWDDTPTNGLTSKGVTSDWAYDHVNAVAAHGSQFVDRGDPAAIDYDEDDLTEDGTWRDLDLSSIVPAGAHAVLLGVTINEDTVGQLIKFRKNGNSNEINWGGMYCIVANVTQHQDILVECDSSRVIEYNGSDTFGLIEIVVRGWWL